MSEITTSQPITGSISFESTEPGPHVAIVSGVHGDEVPGMIATGSLIKEIQSAPEGIQGKITIIHTANEEAVHAGQRKVQFDMNRLFISGAIQGTRNSAYQGLPVTYEQIRASNIAKVVEDADVLLDVHATTKPTPTGFALCSAFRSEVELAKLLEGIGYIILDPGTQGPLDQFASRNGTTALTYETGHLSDNTVVPTVIQNLKMVLSHIGVAFPEHVAEDKSIEPITIELYGKVEMQEPFYVPCDYRNFDVVKAGDVIAITGGREVVATEKTYIVFPKKSPEPGDTALELAKESDANDLPERTGPIGDYFPS